MNDAVLEKYAAEKGIKLEERRPSLNVRVTEGKKKAAEQPKNLPETAAKSRVGSALE
jgi:hypothetical protein